MEGFNQQDPATGTIWHDHYPDLIDQLYSLTLQEINFADNDVDYYFQPLTYLAHSRMGETGERSEVRFGRKVGKNFSAVVGALLLRGNEYESYGNYEKQQGILKFKYQRDQFYFSGNAVHQYLRQGHQDSLPLTKIYDIGQISLNFWRLLFNYQFYDLYHHHYQSPINSSGWSKEVHQVNLLFNPINRSKLNAEIFTGATAVLENSSYYRYRAGIAMNAEILPLLWLNLNASLDSDTNYQITCTGLYRPSSNYSIYGGYLHKYYPYPLIDSLASTEIPRFRSKTFIGFKYLSSKFSADLAAGYIFKSTNTVFQGDRWQDIDREVDFTGGVNINIEILNHLNFYGMGFKELNETGSAQLHYHQSFYQDDLTIHCLPGISVLNEQEFKYYPHLLLKAEILSFEMYWRVMLENQKSRYDYGFVWNITN